MLPGRLVLASASASRRELLHNAGIDVTVDPAALDESEIRRAMAKEAAPAADVAQVLAEAKAVAVSRRHSAQLVLGADQVLVADGAIHDKPADLNDARSILERLRGRQHQLISALAVAREGQVIWRHRDAAQLSMRNFSESFLDAYLESSKDDILDSPGAYRLEGRGMQLFSEIRGDYFTILGLPMTPLLAFLRHHGVVAE